MRRPQKTAPSRPQVTTAGQTWAHPTRHKTNLDLLVSGVPVALMSVHAKVRRDGYRRNS